MIYIGTFSKTMYPGLRIAYLVLPRVLVASLRATHGELYGEGHTTLADFIGEGHYASHVRRMRVVYAARRAALLTLVEKRLGREWLHPNDSNAGLHIVLRLPTGADDQGISRDALAHGVATRPLSRYYSGRERESGLLLGFACVAESEMLPAFESLLACLRRSSKYQPVAD